MKLNNFNANDHDDLNDFEPIPADLYVVAIVDSAEKTNSKGTGSYLELKFQVLEGDHKGRLLWVRLNIDHPNSEAVRIAKAELAAICKAVGVIEPNDSHELHDLPLVAKVRVRTRSDNGELANEVKGYRPRVVSEKSAPQGESSDAAPWKR